MVVIRDLGQSVISFLFWIVVLEVKNGLNYDLIWPFLFLFLVLSFPFLSKSHWYRFLNFEWIQALLKALGDRKGIRRFGDFSAPLDEALVHVVLVSPYSTFIVCRDFASPTRSKLCSSGFFLDCRNNLTVIRLMPGFVGTAIFGLWSWDTHRSSRELRHTGSWFFLHSKSVLLLTKKLYMVHLEVYINEWSEYL